MPDSIPRWREDFPINWEDDHYVTRRSFTTFLTFISSALFLGTGTGCATRMVAALATGTVYGATHCHGIGYRYWTG